MRSLDCVNVHSHVHVDFVLTQASSKTCPITRVTRLSAFRVCEIAYLCHSNATIQKVSFVVNSSGGGLFGGSVH